MIFLKRIFPALCALVSLNACSGGDKFLADTPPPPPPPPAAFRYEKVYTMDVSSSASSPKDVDIIWVIDNSSSMGPYQSQVISNSDRFMREFTSTSKLHWKMGLVSTDEFEQPYMGFSYPVDYTTSDALYQFNYAVGRLGINGSTVEKSFTPVENALTYYPGFHRPGAYLILIFVSDEEEQSWISTDQFLSDMINKVGGDASKFAAFGVFGPNSNYANRKYDEIVNRTGGKTYDLLSSDYGTVLAQLGQDLAKWTMTVSPDIMLDQLPQPETIRVSYKGIELRPGIAAIGGQWTYDPLFNVIHILDNSVIDKNQLDVKVSFELLHASPPANP